MNKGIRTVVYPVQDVAKAKEPFRAVLRIEPYVATPYYVDFKVGT